jgi:hypothetical protein
LSLGVITTSKVGASGPRAGQTTDVGHDSAEVLPQGAKAVGVGAVLEGACVDFAQRRLGALGARHIAREVLPAWSSSPNNSGRHALEHIPSPALLRVAFVPEGGQRAIDAFEEVAGA